MIKRRRVMIGTKSVDDYLTFTALEDGTFTLTIASSVDTSCLTSVAYSLDNGATWVTTDNTASAVTVTTPTVAAGSKVKWKGVGVAYATGTALSRSSCFSSTGDFSVSGNIMSLLFGDNYKEKRVFSKYYAFCNLFRNSKITDAGNLLLPAETLNGFCYQEMFRDCTSLTTAPALPATTLAGNCYYGMFRSCTSLTTAPALPATTLAGNCYYGMFDGCTRLTTAPELPATTLANGCYLTMFASCTSLTTAPALPATTLKTQCYAYMFQLCTKLSSVTCLATDISATGCITGWLYRVAATGTFTKAAGVTWPTGDSGIPNGWTVVDAV